MDQETRMLPVKLTPNEVMQAQEELAHRIVEQETVEAEKSTANERFNAAIKDLRQKVSSLARMVERREEMRSVNCTSRNEDGLWVTRREDTGEIVHSRAPQTEREKQQELL